MSRGTPGEWSRLRLPDRELRLARRITCPTCRQDVATRRGVIAGHYMLDQSLCVASSMPVPADLKETP